MGVSLTIKDRIGNSVVVEWPNPKPNHDPIYNPEDQPKFELGTVKTIQVGDLRVMANTEIDVAKDYLIPALQAAGCCSRK